MKSYFLLLFLFLFSGNFYSQITLEDHVIIDHTTSVDGPTSLATGDMDGDGDTDVVVASLRDKKISWYENLNDNLVYAKQKVIANDADYPSSIFISDFDNDGDNDVLATIVYENKIVWYENLDGAGNFSAELVISTETESSEFVVASDLDNDGDLDVISTSFEDDKLAWYENLDGLGNFGSQNIISINLDGAASAFPADLDNDGDIDIISTAANGHEVVWFENIDGNGNFSTKMIISNEVIAPLSSIAADIDGDGNLDIASSSWVDNKIAWYKNLDGLGSFGNQQIISLSADNARNVFASDIDNDGDIDLLSSSEGDRKIAWYENLDGLGNFSNEKIIAINYHDCMKVFADDLDNDGDIDVLHAQDYVGEVFINENLDGLGNFDDVKLLSKSVLSINTMLYEDIDGDDNKDVICSSSNRISWFKNENGSGNFGVQNIISYEHNGSKRIAAGDIDNDNDTDVIAISDLDDTISLFKNTGSSGNFEDELIIAVTASGVRKVMLGDVNGDNYLDIIVGYSNNGIRLYKNNNGTFNSFVTINNRNSHIVDLADIDSDGDLDVLAVSQNSDTIYWLNNLDGNGEYSDAQIITSTFEFPTSVDLKDIDNDGDIDLVSSSSDDKVVWFKNLDGLGNFSQEIVISNEVENPSSVFLVDFDFDGDNDLFTASSIAGVTSEIKLHFNDGNGNYISNTTLSTNESDIISIYTADFDGDNDLDILPVSKSHIVNGTFQNFHKISWYENTGVLGVDDFNNTDLTLFPIPTSGIIYLKSFNNIRKIEIFNISGNLVKIINSTDFKEFINISSFSAGLYFINITKNNGEVVRKKIVKE